MASFPDSQLDIKVESCTVSKKAYLLSDNVTINLALKNIANSTIKSMWLYLVFPFSELDPTYTGYNYYLIDIKSFSSLGWTKNTIKNFSVTFNSAKIIKVYDSTKTSTVFQKVTDRLEAIRSLPLRISAWVDRGGSGEDKNVQDYPALNYSIPNTYYINKRYMKSIKFNLVRSPSDESTTLAATMKVTFTSDAGEYKNDFTAKLYYALGENVSESSTEKAMAISYNVLYGTGYTNNTTVVTGNFPIANTYSFLLVVSDGKEVLTAKTIVSRAFANVHFSGQPTGGVAFGRFSTSQLNNPKFECEYPAHFYNGIADYGMTWENLSVESGVITPDPNNNGNGALCVGKLPGIMNGIVFLKGGINVRPLNSAILIATLPSGYRPSGSIYRYVACDGTRYGRIHIDPNGELYLDWVYYCTGTRYNSANIWIDCNICFLI